MIVLTDSVKQKIHKQRFASRLFPLPATLLCYISVHIGVIQHSFVKLYSIHIINGFNWQQIFSSKNPWPHIIIYATHYPCPHKLQVTTLSHFYFLVYFTFVSIYKNGGVVTTRTSCNGNKPDHPRPFSMQWRF